MDISTLYKLYTSSTGICTDTRKLQQGQLYIALKGDNFNGNKFAQKALDAGASHCLIDESEFMGAKCTLVEDGLLALQDLARHHRETLTIPIIGLTGSNGKTTSKELLVAALKQKFQVAYTKGNLNNHIGVPLSILEIRAEDEIAVIEMGANAQKEISFLSHLSKPDIGFITNFGKAHLEGFGGPEGVIIGKSELFDYLRANGKMAWVNLRDDLQVTKSLGIEQKTFGDHSEADFIIRSATNKANSLVAVEFENAVIQSKLTGAYNFTNLAIAVSLAAHFGVETKAIKKGIEGYQPENNRSQLEPGKKNLLLKDYYNANPSSMDAAIINFKQITEKKAKDKWLILGDMFELGTFEAEEHQRVADLALSLVCDKTILVGKAFARTKGQALRFETTLEAENWILTHLPEGKLILIKGSRGMALESIAALL